MDIACDARLGGSDPAALSGDAAEGTPLRVRRLVGDPRLGVDAPQGGLDGAGRARRSELGRDLLVRGECLEVRAGEPGPAEALHDLALEARELRALGLRELAEPS